jgi:hypothetical protein
MRGNCLIPPAANTCVAGDSRLQTNRLLSGNYFFSEKKKHEVDEKVTQFVIVSRRKGSKLLTKLGSQKSRV